MAIYCLVRLATPLPPVGDVNAKVPLMVLAVTVPEKVKAPKLSEPVTVPAPEPAPALFNVPEPLPTALDENVKFSVWPEIVPDPVPAWLPRPNAARPITPVDVALLPLTMMVACSDPETLYRVSVHVPAHVVVPLREPKDNATVTASVALLPCDTAVMVVVPAATTVTRPVPDTAATPGADDDQVEELVTFCVDPSESVAVAMNWLVWPTAESEAVPLMAIETTVADGVGEVVVDFPPHEATITPATTMLSRELLILE